MSLNQFQVIGDVYFYEPQFNQSHYYPSSGRHLGYLVEEILLHFDNQINYSAYDNWSGTLNQPDGFVDMIKICIRNAHMTQLDPPGYQGIMNLTGWKQKFGSLPVNTPLVLDGVKISPTSSGTINNGVFDPHYGLPVMAHELGHYLFGTVHFSGIGFHGLMDGEGTGVVSSFERAKLGWIIPIPFETDATDAIIPDAITTGVVRKINIPNSNNYFLIDNHQRISFYEASWLQHYDGPLVSPGTGVLITHCTPHSVDVESAFGRWDWKKENGLYIYPFEKENVNRLSGEDKLNLRSKVTTTGLKKSHPEKLGSLQDFFNIGYNQLFSPWSNPSTYPDDSKIAIELLQIDQYKNAHLNIYLQDAYLAPPSKPQNLKVTSQYYGYESLLTWEANIEPDMINGGKYKIYRSENSENNFYLIATINAYVNGQPVTSFIDEEVGSSRYNKIYYRITAFDNTNKESVPSDFDWRFGRVPKESILNDALELIYRLSSNYPNPFNPSTVIHYSVKDAGLVSLKVFDILGREVVVLVNDIKDAGNHSVEFNAFNLPSGVYIYTLQVNGYTNSKKMLLLK